MVPKVQTNKALKIGPNPQEFISGWIGVKTSSDIDAIFLVPGQYLKYDILGPLKTKRVFDRKTGRYWESNLGAVHRIITQSVGRKFASSFLTHQRMESLGERGIDRFLMEDGTMIPEAEMQRKMDQGELVGVREHFFVQLTSAESERLRQSIHTKGTKCIFVCKQDLPSIMSLGEARPHDSNAQLMFGFDIEILTSLLLQPREVP